VQHVHLVVAQAEIFPDILKCSHAQLFSATPWNQWHGGTLSSARQMSCNHEIA
jgi:hypothetical protein